jgi:S1-C subfamily serine protease
MRDGSEEDPKQPSVSTAGETTATEITARAADGGAADGGAADLGAAGGADQGRAAEGSSAEGSGAEDSTAEDSGAEDSPAQEGVALGARGRRYGRLAMAVGAAVIVAVAAFAAFTAAGWLSGPARPSSAIPSPPRENKTFVEDDDGTGADSQANILQSAAPGLVHIVSASGATAGVGMVLTPSGLVLTSDHILGGARRASVRTVLAGRRFSARVLGADPAKDLALLQIEGGSPAFKTVAIGNSRDFTVGAAVTAVGSTSVTKTIALDLGNLDSPHGTATVGGKRLTGLLESSLQSVPGEQTGGPLVNLSGQAIGITVAGAGSGLHCTGFAVPINEALAVAKSIQASHSG